MDARRVLRRGEGRFSLWSRRGRHEGRHRLQRRCGARLSERQWRQAAKGRQRLDLVSDHRGRRGHFGQRHHQASEMVRRARRKIRPLRARRAVECRGPWRLHQDRPPRLAVRHALCRRRAGPRRLSASRRQSGAGYFAADRGALRRATRSRQRPVPGIESGIHLRRRRQHRWQRDSRARRAQNSTSASTTTTPRRRCARWSRSGWRKPAATASAPASCGNIPTPTCS